MIPALHGRLLALREQLLRPVGEGAGEGGVAGLLHQEVPIIAGGRLGVQDEGVLALGLQGGVIPEQVPVAAGHGVLHLHLAVCHTPLDGVHLTGGVADDEGGAGVGVRLPDGHQGLVGVCAHGHLGHVDVAVLHGDLGQALLTNGLTGGGELSHRAEVGGLGGLAPGVGIHLGVKHEDVHILAGGDDVVQTDFLVSRSLISTIWQQQSQASQGHCLPLSSQSFS